MAANVKLILNVEKTEANGFAMTMIVKDLNGKEWRSVIPGKGNSVKQSANSIANSVMGSALIARTTEKLLIVASELEALSEEELDVLVDKFNLRKFIPKISKRDTKEQKLMDYLAGA